MHLRPTSPLRIVDHIDQGIELFIDNFGIDSLRSITPANQHPMKMWQIVDGMLLPFIRKYESGLTESYNMPRQKLPEIYIQNASVDIIWSETILKKNSMSGDIILPFILEEEVSVNIDTEVDFILAESLIKNRDEK